MTTANESTHSYACEEIVNLLAAKDPRGQQLLLGQFSRGMIYLASRLCPAHASDCVTDTVTIVVSYLKEKRLEDSSALPCYIRTVLRSVALGKHQTSDRGDTLDRVFGRDQRTPEEIAAFNDRRSAMRRTLDEMSAQERETLVRFYMNGESEEQICEEMGLTERQYRRLKGRGRSRLQAVMRAKV